jgi:glycosyltransferase involved in cell wall biosynthesis
MFDVLHVHGAWPVGLASPVIARESGIPVVITFHIQDDGRLVSGSAGSELYRTMLDHAAAFVVVGSPLERFLADLAHRTIESKLHRIPNGVDLGEIGGVLNELKGHEPEWQSVVSVGNLWPVKGIDLNLRALARLADRKIPWSRYTIIGDGPERPALERLAEELGLTSRVNFKGTLPHRAVLREVARAGIFSLPSWQESFGAAHLEAMACGRPVIGCRTQGIEDMIEHRKEGLLVEPKNVEALASALEMLLTHPETAREMGRRGQSVARKLTWSRSADRYMSLYRSLEGE